MEAVGKVLMAVGVNYVVHYAVMTTHNWMCLPHTLKEIGQSLFLTASPACSTLLTVGQHTQNGYAVAATTATVGLILSGLKCIG
jgi:hypothetical protein